MALLLFNWKVGLLGGATMIAVNEVDERVSVYHAKENATSVFTTLSHLCRSSLLSAGIVMETDRDL